ncbi:bifunctional diaminohydroxyphosphoribosylaminopyrimidine deaminase/5-amino-6-(5-phosphoribosylamino)uracil reductase RibD [Siculibacillus lacustris]|uniref:Riboflavin biosynthesis protein RibD n=2 Tax=Siculibacillus lacustris TaxID=1549641 RepID=A0A4Q9VUB3_9HYPH|nr:bifunctional diaminohydroxyphosphoribosylaminopyrimidine deaminase/5-amino-6-(5-phosphoribosylamino)uracil reductase RibD [Siculibacillus lacustris]
MAAAVRLARRHLGLTAPNPSVGAIVVADGPDGRRVVGRGVTALGGRPHAEPQALRQAGDAARGATLYVTLEPCSHHGVTPPCVEAIIAAGIVRVVAAVSDPDPRVAGRGFARLAAAGIAVTTGVAEASAADGLCGHLARVRLGRPHVLLKLAVSADRRIGRRDVANLAITGPAARARAQLMRAETDAVAVGIGTAEIDDPALTVRLPGLAAASPVRVVFDAAARLAPRSRLAQTAREIRVIDLVAAGADPDRCAALAALGVEILPVARGADGRLDLAAALTALAAGGITSVLVEGGAEIAAALARRDLIDAVALFESDTVVGPDGLALPAILAAALAADGGSFDVAGREIWGPDRLTLFHRRAVPTPSRSERS